MNMAMMCLQTPAATVTRFNSVTNTIKKNFIHITYFLKGLDFDFDNDSNADDGDDDDHDDDDDDHDQDDHVDTACGSDVNLIPMKLFTPVSKALQGTV